MFAPTLAQGGDGQAERQLRIAFANVGTDGLRTLGERLATLGPGVLSQASHQ
jgi:hypothetical protein